MTIELYSKSKVYVAAPANFATGGPELLHQLVYNLRKLLNVDAYMYYYPKSHPNPVHPEYKVYNNPYTYDIEDKEWNLIIVPEVKSGISILRNFKEIRKAIWWLSVDYFFSLICMNLHT